MDYIQITFICTWSALSRDYRHFRDAAFRTLHDVKETSSSLSGPYGYYSGYSVDLGPAVNVGLIVQGLHRISNFLKAEKKKFVRRCRYLTSRRYDHLAIIHATAFMVCERTGALFSL